MANTGIIKSFNMKQISLLLACCLLLTTAFAQGRKNKKQTAERSGMLAESYDSIPGIGVAYSMAWQKATILSGTLVNGRKEGLWKFANIEGNHSYEGNYHDDKKNGEWNYYRDKKLLAKVYFKDDLADSLWQSYYEGGQLQGQMNSHSGKLNGIYRLYYENGVVARESGYRNDTSASAITVRYMNGTVRYTAEYKDGLIYNITALNDSLDHKLDPGTMKDGSGLLKRYDRKGSLYSEVEYKDGLKNGSAKLYNKGKCIYWYSFENGKQSGLQRQYNRNGDLTLEGYCANGFKAGTWKEHNPDVSSTNSREYRLADSITVAAVDFEPDFHTSTALPFMQGGEDAMVQFVGANVIYPKAARKKGIHGHVYVTFVVDRSGRITNTRILRGVSDELDAEALRVVNLMPLWTPGFQDGFPVNVQFNLPIKFSLQ
ncbi:MAG: TonB family protein [Bacteroidetes bacterium]|nr:TonB family protein [Bacteroidota bacterium]